MTALSRTKRQPPALPSNAVRELALLERDFGGRQAIVQALVLAPQTADLRYLLGILGDPDNDPKSLAECLHLGRILPGQLLEALTRGTTARSTLLSRQKISDRAPTVVAEVMQKAAEFEADCTDCQGLGEQTADPTDDHQNPLPVQCATCAGTGRLRYPADPSCRDLALEMAGLTGKGGGVTVNTAVQVTNQVSGALAAGYERMQEAVDTILYGDRGALPDIDAVAQQIEPSVDSPRENRVDSRPEEGPSA